MKTKGRIRFRGTLESTRRSGRQRPGLAAWAVVFAVTLVVCFVPVIGFLGLAFLVFLIPAAVGSFFGWFLGGLRDEWKSLRHGS